MTLEDLVEDLTGLNADEILEKVDDLLDKPLKDLGISKTEALFMGGVFDKLFGDYIRDALNEVDDRRRAEKDGKSDNQLEEFLDAFFDAFFDNLDSDSSEEDADKVAKEVSTAFTNGALDCQLADFFRSNVKANPFCNNVVTNFCGQIDSLCSTK